jgi:hypothetical protein
MNEGGGSRNPDSYRDRKSGSPKVRKKSQVESSKSEEEKAFAFDIPIAIGTHSELTKSNPDSYRDEYPTSEIKTMEVHHHPEVEKKGFKEYILEGLMIFLAVTMGFFAETIREGISDSTKGKEYIRSFVRDLQRDTGTFSHLVAFDQTKTAALSTLFPCFDAIEKTRATGCLVPIIKSSLSNKDASFTDGTIQQLKNAGGFRLLNKADKDSIVAYDHAVRSYQNFESTLFQERQDIVREMYVKLVNFKAEPMLVPVTVNDHVETPLLFSNDKTLINEFFNDLLLYKRVNENQIKIITALKNRATGIIKYFDNKYDLE